MKLLNNRLEEQQQFYEYILNNIPSDIAVFDEQHRYLSLILKALRTMS